MKECRDDDGPIEIRASEQGEWLVSLTPTASIEQQRKSGFLEASETHFSALETLTDVSDEQGPIKQQELNELLQLSYPTVLISLLEFFPGFICIVLVGHIDSPNSNHYVDAATLSAMFTNVTALAVAYGLCTALDTLCSQAFGADKPMKIGIYLQAGFVVIGACMVPICLVNWFTTDILRLFQQDEEIARLAGEFSRITIFGVPFVVFYEMNRRLLQAQRIVKPLMVMAILGNITMLGLGYWMTYHTSLGFHGAAWARSIAYMVLALSMLLYYFATKSYRKWWCGWDLKLASRYVGQFLSLGLPGMCMIVMEWWAYDVTGLFAGMLPDPVISVNAHAVFYNMCTMMYMTFLGISIAGNIRVGNALGANKPRHAHTIAQVVLMLAFGVGCIGSVLLLALRHQIPRMFLDDQEAITRAAKCLLVLIPFQMLESLNSTIQGIYRGIGKQKIAAIVNGISFYAIGLPLGALCAFVLDWSVEGIWGGFGAGVAFCIVVCSIFLYRCSWEKLAQEAQERTNY